MKSSYEHLKIPYMWKINERIFTGLKNRRNIWENGLSSCFQYVQNSLVFMKVQIPNQIKTIIYLPAKLFSLILGRRKLTPIWSPDYHREVVKDFWTDIMEN